MAMKSVFNIQPGVCRRDICKVNNMGAYVHLPPILERDAEKRAATTMAKLEHEQKGHADTEEQAAVKLLPDMGKSSLNPKHPSPDRGSGDIRTLEAKNNQKNIEDKENIVNSSENKDEETSSILTKINKEAKNREKKAETLDGSWHKYPFDSGRHSPMAPTITTMAKYPASILHNRNPVYQYHKRERKKQRRHRRLAESGPSGPVAASFFPKVTHPKPSTFQSSMNGASYSSSNHGLPKLGGSDTKPNPHSYFPSLSQAFVKQAKTKATKNMYGHYQLPSIDKRGAGY